MVGRDTLIWNFFSLRILNKLNASICFLFTNMTIAYSSFRITDYHSLIRNTNFRGPLLRFSFCRSRLVKNSATRWKLNTPPRPYGNFSDTCVARNNFSQALCYGPFHIRCRLVTTVLGLRGHIVMSISERRELRRLFLLKKEEVILEWIRLHN